MATTILNIDTDILRSSVSVAEQANSEIDEAASLLNAITVHEDWMCTERDKIKEMTLTNKQTAQKIQERSAAFYSAIKTASENFDATEQENNQNINGVDDIIGKIASTVPAISEQVFGGTGGCVLTDPSVIDVSDLASVAADVAKSVTEE
jgi:hypothetical protein